LERSEPPPGDYKGGRKLRASGGEGLIEEENLSVLRGFAGKGVRSWALGVVHR